MFNIFFCSNVTYYPLFSPLKDIKSSRDTPLVLRDEEARAVNVSDWQREVVRQFISLSPDYCC